MKQFFVLKIIDGLFLGDRYSLKCEQFLISNKITLIINCAASQIFAFSNIKSDIKILNFTWLDNDTEIILDESSSFFDKIYNAIQESFLKCQGVLVCSVKGQSRSLTILTGFLMKKFKWTLFKTLQYINSKRNDFQLRRNFLQQLVALETKLYGISMSNCTNDWNGAQIQSQGELLKNTFLNSMMGRKNKSNNEQNRRKRSTNKKNKSVKFIELNMVINQEKKSTEAINLYRLREITNNNYINQFHELKSFKDINQTTESKQIKQQIDQINKNNKISAKDQKIKILQQSSIQKTQFIQNDNNNNKIRNNKQSPNSRENLSLHKRNKTQLDEQTTFKISTKYLNRKVITPYKIRKHSDFIEKQKLQTEPTILPSTNPKILTSNRDIRKKKLSKYCKQVLQYQIQKKGNLNDTKIKIYLNQIFPAKNLLTSARKKLQKPIIDKLWGQKQRSASTNSKSQNKYQKYNQLYSKLLY